MTYKDIVAKKVYTKDGVEKATWLKVGTIRTTDDGKQFVELNMFPQTSFYVFEQKEKGAPKAANIPTPEDWAE